MESVRGNNGKKGGEDERYCNTRVGAHAQKSLFSPVAAAAGVARTVCSTRLCAEEAHHRVDYTPSAGRWNASRNRFQGRVPDAVCALDFEMLCRDSRLYFVFVARLFFRNICIYAWMSCRTRLLLLAFL